jgi:hypothetical protein
MFVRDGNVGFDREAAKYVYSLRWRGISGVGEFRDGCGRDGMSPADDHDKLCELSSAAVTRSVGPNSEFDGR